MRGRVNDIKSWLMSLEEEELRTLLTWHPCLRGQNCVHGTESRARRVAPSRREITSVRVWLAKAQAPHLTSAAVCGLGWVTRLLEEEYGWPHHVLAEPTVDQLSAMLEVLEPPLAHCALYGLLVPRTESLPAGALAHEHETRLRAAANRRPPPDARAVGPAFTEAESKAEPEPEPEPEPKAEPEPEPEATREEAPAVSPEEPQSEAVDTVLGPDLFSELHTSLALLRRTGENLADELRALAADLTEGRQPSDAVLTAAVDGVPEWARSRRALAARLTAAGGTWPPGGGYAAAEEEVGRREEKLAELRRKSVTYAGLIAVADDEEEAADLERVLRRVQQQLAAFGVPAPEEPPAGVPRPPEGTGTPARPAAPSLPTKPEPPRQPGPSPDPTPAQAEGQALDGNHAQAGSHVRAEGPAQAESQAGAQGQGQNQVQAEVQAQNENETRAQAEGQARIPARTAPQPGALAEPRPQPEPADGRSPALADVPARNGGSAPTPTPTEAEPPTGGPSGTVHGVTGTAAPAPADAPAPVPSSPAPAPAPVGSAPAPGVPADVRGAAPGTPASTPVTSLSGPRASVPAPAKPAPSPGSPAATSAAVPSAAVPSAPATFLPGARASAPAPVAPPSAKTPAPGTSAPPAAAATPAPAPVAARSGSAGAAALPEEDWPVGVVQPDWDPGAPWETGAESPVARLLGQGRVADAYWVTRASRESDERARALAFAAAAFGCVSDSEATPVQITHEFDAPLSGEDREAHLVALAAALRAGLTARWPHGLVSGFVMPSGLTSPWQQLLNVLVAAVRDGRGFEPGTLQTDEERNAAQLREEIAQTARQLLDDLPRRKMKYQRASQVLKYLIGPSGRLHKALDECVAWAERSPAAGSPGFREAGEELWRTEGIDRIIEDADALFRTSKQAKEPITAGALRQLHAACRSVGELLIRAEAAHSAVRPSAGASERGIPELGSALRGVADEPVPSGVGGAALGLLRAWLVGAPTVPGEQLASDDAADRLRENGGPVPSGDCLLGLCELPRHPDGEPDLADPRTALRMAALLAPAAPAQALERYLETGDLHLAKALIAAVERAPAAMGCPDPEWRDAAGRQLAQAHERWRRQVGERHTLAAELLAQMRTLNQLAPDRERHFAGRLQQFADGEESGRYRFALASLNELEAELGALVEKAKSRLREDLEQLRTDPEHPLAPNDRDRIARLIDEGDTVTAQEFLSLATSRKPLPERLADDDAELLDFLTGAISPQAPKAGGEGVSARWWASHYGGREPSLTQAARSGLESWEALCTARARSGQWQQHIPRVLRLLGLQLSTHQLTPAPVARGQGMRRFEARARVAERPGYVATLGSRSTTYTVLLVWEEQPADGPLAHLEDADVGANIVLYLHPLGAEGRRALAESARSSAQQALVVDSTVMGWMAARAPGSFRSLQRVTLPWATYNPYTPFVAGLVPPEVFYGRDEEMREVMGRDGGMFLYGGRQLGKSALLRRVADVFPSGSDAHVAVYLDLLKAEIGHAEAPERIWSRLVEDLKRKGVFTSKMSEQAAPDTVVKNIRDWLDQDPTRRILVLADEADAFLNTDSRRAFRVGSESTFPNVMHFQRLMEQTERRFKIVFAGLHQVQRFGHLSNVSTVHGGPDVLIGPLGTRAAVRLVTEPMAALGHFFERPELVWRILAITNYQANLVQIFCRELVRVLHARPYTPAVGPVRITEDDVQKVAASETVRQQIAERLRFTINLEDRYRVLALVIALRSLEDGYRGDYSASELLEAAREAWSRGFEMLSAKQVQIFLTEMVGLGLLIQLGDRSRFAVRSPNVVNMLGTREELELELSETEFGLPYDYNPRAARRILGRDQRGVQRYSPLTEEQLHEAAQPGVTVIGATRLHRPELIKKAVAAFAENRGVTVLGYARGEDLGTVLKLRHRKAQVLVADLLGASADELREAVRQLLAHAGRPADTLAARSERRSGGTDNRSVVVLSDVERVGELDATDQGADLSSRRLFPERWSADALRAWSECPFVSREDRDRLVAATGGWPRWMEDAVTDVSVYGATLESAVERIKAVIARPANLDAHLERSGLDARDLDLLSVWSSYVDEGQGAPRDDIQAAVELTREETDLWLDRLHRLGVLDGTVEGFALEPVTYRAVRARSAAGEP
ncbi:hypothetical protein ACFQ8C_12960 [Streptomyces sp. NPDC056503]|uniref:hypothetical protein n=1 Tax=Streptomyces sp. NPDC056503 TaxID=3345842 RepID=UPI0036CA073F